MKKKRTEHDTAGRVGVGRRSRRCSLVVVEGLKAEVNIEAYTCICRSLEEAEEEEEEEYKRYYTSDFTKTV